MWFCRNKIVKIQSTLLEVFAQRMQRGTSNNIIKKYAEFSIQLPKPRMLGKCACKTCFNSISISNPDVRNCNKCTITDPLFEYEAKKKHKFLNESTQPPEILSLG